MWVQSSCCSFAMHSLRSVTRRVKRSKLKTKVSAPPASTRSAWRYNRLSRFSAKMRTRLMERWAQSRPTNQCISRGATS